MTTQTAFNRIYRHLMKQRRRCVDRQGSCRYRFRGMKCAIGVLIPDSAYKRRMEGIGIELLVDMAPVSNLFKGVDRFVLGGAQSIHDCYNVCDWRDALARLAQDRGLSIPKLRQPKNARAV